MLKKDISELKRRLKKDNCTFTKVCGCYVDSDKKKVTNIDEIFLNLDDSEYFKYLEIAKKVVSGKLKNNLLELSFDKSSGQQQSLLKFKKSCLYSRRSLSVSNAINSELVGFPLPAHTVLPNTSSNVSRFPLLHATSIA